jgi:hypothetical protein
VISKSLGTFCQNCHPNCSDKSRGDDKQIKATHQHSLQDDEHSMINRIAVITMLHLSCGGWVVAQSQLTTPSAQPAPIVQPSQLGARVGGQPADVSPQTQQQVSRAVNTPSSGMRTSNLFARGSGRINIMSDIFDNSGSQITVPHAYFFNNVQPIELQNGVLGFNIGVDNAPDLFTVGPPANNLSFQIAEPTPPTEAPIPSGNGVTYVGGTATPAAGPTFPQAFDLAYTYSQTTALPSNGGLLLGRQKIAANTSPIPRTRIFADYSFFYQTQLLGGTNVNRWTPGAEYAFDDETSSIEVRMPMGVTVNSDIFTNNIDNSEFQLGNLFLVWKSLLLERESWLVSGGVSVSLPTAEDLNVFSISQSNQPLQLVSVKNESVQVQPFLGWFANQGMLFTQGFLQADLDVSGSTVMVNRNPRQTGLSQLGVVQNTNLLYFDVQLGYWLRRLERSSGRSGMTALAPIFELHVNRSLHAQDVVGSRTDFASSGGYQIGSPLSDVQVTNAIVGLMIERDYFTQMNIGFATPLGNGGDAGFDGELRLSLNRYF